MEEQAQVSTQASETKVRKPVGPAKMTAIKVWNWWNDSIEASREARKAADKNCAYYDNEQWTSEEKEELRERGQAPLIRNEIKPTLDLVIGTERKSRVEFTTAPRGQNDVQNAEIAKEILKYVGDVNHQKHLCSESFMGLVKAGWGWLELCENDDPFGDPISMKTVPRADLTWDHYATRYDKEDGKYIIRGKWLELEDAINKFPKAEIHLRTAVGEQVDQEGLDQPYQGTEDRADRPGVFQWESSKKSSVFEWVDRDRKRVRLLECWYKTPTDTWLVENELTGDIDEFDPDNAAELLFTPGIKITKSKLRKVRVCIVAGSEIIEDNPSPYRHNCFPFVPFWGYLSDKKRMPYGIIEQLRDMQDEINKRHSKAMFLLNARQVIADSDAIDMKQNDWRQVADEVSKPDGIVKLDGTKASRRFEIVKVGQEIQQQYEFQKDAQDAIRNISGVPGELRGEDTNATSGRAIIARGVQGHTMLGELFDNYRFSCQIIEERKWAMVQQFYTKPKAFRITDQMGGYEFLEINKYMDDGSGQILVQNDITKAKVDIVIDEQVYHATIRQALMEQMMEMVGKLPPETAMMLLDMVVDYSDLPKKDEMVQRIRMIQGTIVQNQQAEKEAELMKAAGVGTPEGPGQDSPVGIESQMAGGTA